MIPLNLTQFIQYNIGMKNTDLMTENDQLKQRLIALELQLSDQHKVMQTLDQSNLKKDHKIAQLVEYIRYMEQQRFAPSSEKLNANPLNLFDEAELLSDDDEQIEDDVVDKTPRKRQKKRLSIPAELPRVEVVHDVSEAEKICPHDGTVLRHFGDEISEQLQYMH